MLTCRYTFVTTRSLFETKVETVAVTLLYPRLAEKEGQKLLTIYQVLSGRAGAYEIARSSRALRGLTKHMWDKNGGQMSFDKPPWGEFRRTGRSSVCRGNLTRSFTTHSLGKCLTSVQFQLAALSNADMVRRTQPGTPLSEW